MAGMIDIHSHILPGLDDGSSSMEETLRMLWEAQKQGIRRVFATPHYSAGFPKNDPARIKEAFRHVCRAARDEGLRIRISSGMEILYTEEVPMLLREKKLLTMAGSRYVMLEFHPTSPYLTIQRAVQSVVSEGFHPILAHVERYEALKTEEKMEALRDQGALMQMNFRSVTGGLFDERSRRCRALLKKKRIDFMGTDMHNMRSRTPESKEAVRWMRRHLDAVYVQRILKGNAQEILEEARSLRQR